MIKAVLLDLDNTLLYNPDRAFAIAYLKLADNFFQTQLGYTGFSRLLRQTIPAIIQNGDVHKSNAEIAIELIANKLDVDPTIISNQLATFYLDVFAQLEPCTSRIPGASDLVHYLEDQGFSVVIATNPIYPANAIVHRLRWAGLSSNLNDYAFVSHSENMHFAKPQPEYYVEILARVGVEPDEVVMVGDSLKNDREPTQILGIHFYQIIDSPSGGSSGTLETFFELVRDGWLDTLIHKQLLPRAIYPQLRGNLGALFGLLDTAPPHYWLQQPDPDEWSILQIVCHLLESEKAVQRPRLERILAETNPFLVSPKPPPGPEARICDDDSYRVAHSFVRERKQSLRFVASLGDDDWQRPARHSVFGMTNLLEMAHFTAQHDRLHLTQLCQTIGNCV